MCPHTTMCPHITIYVSSYYICPHTTICVSSYYYMCPHTTIYVLILQYSVLILLYMSSYYYICVLIEHVYFSVLVNWVKRTLPLQNWALPLQGLVNFQHELNLRVTKPWLNLGLNLRGSSYLGQRRTFPTAAFSQRDSAICMHMYVCMYIYIYIYIYA
jgi:hypothetical protein